MKYITLLLISILTQLSLAQEPIYYVNISTNLGNMKIKLYNETPSHRDNFLRLVGKKHFDGTLFYRVVKGFVIQGGSSDSRNAAQGRAIGYGKAINIDSEFSKECYHKRGAICAPRQPEDVNHFKMSDISQFYIVQGRKYKLEELTNIEKATNNPIKKELKQQFYIPHKEELARLKTENPKEFNKLLRQIKDKINFHYSISDKKEFTESQKQDYINIGGTPELDGDYTVFGEVVEGLNVLNKIAALEVDRASRPHTDVKIKVTVVKL
ncbi:peptidylprolyl isomerase [Carboxylicivirga sp. N1Y90]|uniref:peptidylprolyl isomerase n=1 Tax=Carboxylicivirga fragile TaxID=3417571 RepID=UPI003D334763|nr:peptidylprolyl isomerase [Marinilabiliaceae bacterium N1Y90]